MRLKYLHYLTIAGATLIGICQSVSAQALREADENLPVFDLDELPVYYSATDFSPSFKVDQPQFTYYDPPDLPNGELILALEFMDRYRESNIPGSAKWAAFLYFPVIDGYERQHRKWLCLYFYNDQMYGYDPMAYQEFNRRFSIPIRYEDRSNKELLFRFAEEYVDRVFPATTEQYFYEETETGYLDEEEDFSFSGMEVEYIDIPAGRIDSMLPSGRGKEPRELVYLLNQYSESPNLHQDTRPVLGKPNGFGKWDFSLSGFWDELTYNPDYLDVARQLVSPRWGQQVYFHYERKLLFFGERPAKRKVLLFNIGHQIYAYHFRYGTWRTDAKLQDLSDPVALASKMAYPGIDVVERVEPIVTANLAQAQNP